MSIREKNSDDMAVIQQENDELKEVLSAVQIDLESKTEVLLAVISQLFLASTLDTVGIS